jgi:hypothetical protein
MTKVGKSDGEGTFPGTHGNSEAAPNPVADAQAGDGARCNLRAADII